MRQTRQVRYCIVCETARVFTTTRPHTCQWCGFEDEERECRLLSEPATPATPTASTSSSTTETTKSSSSARTVDTPTVRERTTLLRTTSRSITAEVASIAESFDDWCDNTLLGAIVSGVLLAMMAYVIICLVFCL